tara:strand:+ start:718 stop:903 length:186 start_codon:yes stop_codon:yes gene_type:complete
MKTGDLVVAKPNNPDEGEMGMVIGFDKDNDPIVFWQFKGLDDVFSDPKAVGTYRSQLEVAQ